MKLLYVIEHISTVGGLERILIEKMNALAAEDGFEVVLMTVWQDEKVPAFPLDKRVTQICLGVKRPISAWGMLAAMPRVLYIYNNKVRAIGPDVVVHFRAIGAMLSAFSSWKGLTVFEAHSARRHSNHRWLYPLMERRVDAVVCLTRGDAANYTRAKRVEVIPNFTSVPPGGSLKSCRSSNSCLFVGRLSPQKDPLRLLRMWKSIVARHPGWQLDIYGEGEMENDMRAEMERLGIEDSVVMHGSVSDIAGMYAGSAMLLLCSRSEGLPMVIIEAMRSGLPVVSTDCPYGPADIIKNGENGLLVAQDDDAAFVDAVSTLMEDGARRLEMGKRASETSVIYSKHNIVETWKSFWQSIGNSPLS